MLELFLMFAKILTWDHPGTKIDIIFLCEIDNISNEFSIILLQNRLKSHLFHE